MEKLLGITFEKAVRLLAQHMPVSSEDSRKSVLFHDIRVGVYLYERGYSQDIVISGILHDALEWSEVSEEALREGFGENVLRLVLASTKDDAITDKQEKTRELISRCVQAGQDALIVKAADILDSFKWYSALDNEGELRYCMRNADAIFKLKPEGFDDKIFDELRGWRDKFSYLSE
jgi:(p)ppGpp synthase/HD superfamily hydrolase